MIKTESRKNLWLVFFSIFSALLLAELYLRFNPPVPVYISTRNIVQHTHSEVSPDPLIAYIPTAGLIKPFRNREFNVSVRINSKNMRDREYTVEKPAGKRRIAVMGDSFVFGWGVENEEVFTELLEDYYLKDTEVMNFGVSGYAAYQEMERLKVEALKFKPDLVLFFLYGLPEAVPVDYHDSYQIVDGRLMRADIAVLPLRRKITRFLERHIYLFSLFQETRGAIIEHFSPQDPEVPDQQAEETRKGLELLIELKKLGAQHGFAPVVVFVPIKQAALDGDSPEAVPVREFCRTQRIDFLDLTTPLHDAWKKTGKAPYFRIDDHWNREGHAETARILADYLKEKGVV